MQSTSSSSKPSLNFSDVPNVILEKFIQTKSLERKWSWNKSYLSYERNSETWKIIKLNPFERLLRLFGFYKSTHLSSKKTSIQDDDEGMSSVRRKAFNKPLLQTTTSTATSTSSQTSKSVPSSSRDKDFSNLSERVIKAINDQTEVYRKARMQPGEIKKILAEEFEVTPEEIEYAWKQKKGQTPNVQFPKQQEVEIKTPKGKTHPVLPGEWFQMQTSQVREGAPNACTSIAVTTAATILRNPSAFTPEIFNDIIREGSKKHLEKFKNIEDNRDVDAAIQAFELRETLSNPIFFSYPLVQTKKGLIEEAISATKGKPFVATLGNYAETIAIYYKNAREIYVLDSHQEPVGNQDLNLGQVAKFANKEELCKFLFEYKYPDEKIPETDQLLGERLPEQLELHLFAIP